MPSALYNRYVPPKSGVVTSQTAIDTSIPPTTSHDAPVAKKDKTVRKPKKRKLESDAVALDNDDDVQRSKQHQNILAKFDKSIKISDRIKQQKEEQGSDDDQPAEAEPELHDLVPLPQPPSIKREPYRPNFSSLPAWLRQPLLIDSKDTQKFEQLGLSAKVLGNLKKRNYTEAFPVQTALVPLLLSNSADYYYGDLCVSAPTGSGKTLGYVLPLVERLKDKIVTSLRAVIVVPTRELVVQARQEAEKCSAGTKLRVGTALGSTNLANERRQLIARHQRYNPAESATLQAVIKERLDSGFMEDDTLLEDSIGLLPDHIPDFRPAIDILICTPGRLVEHIRTTTGFSLDQVQFLVIDEADRLLDESFQEWVDTTLPALSAHDDTVMAHRPLLLRQQRYVQKIILSATMTRDLAKLAALRLQRPKLIAVVGDTGERDTQQSNSNGTTGATVPSVELLELPPTLQEAAVAVGDGSEKPLYLLELLRSELRVPGLSDELSAQSHHLYIGDTDHTISPNTQSRVLVFTNNNEDALRLCHLLSAIAPDLASQIGVLTKTTSKSGRKTLAAFKAGKTTILIASDRASRGLDIPDLTDVISYDIPKSETVYIHRVGRTARAGRSGVGWTFFTDSEARWFWNSIARTSRIQRGNSKVERYKITLDDTDGPRTAYARALESLKTAVLDAS